MPGDEATSISARVYVPGKGWIGGGVGRHHGGAVVGSGLGVGPLAGDALHAGYDATKAVDKASHASAVGPHDFYDSTRIP